MTAINPEDLALGYWNQLKLSAQKVSEHFLADKATIKDGIRILGCATQLRTYSSEERNPLVVTWYCKHPSCPICQWRKSLRRCSQMHQLLDQNPKLLEGKWLYLTLTVRNCFVEDLRVTIQRMNHAFSRMVNRGFWKKNVRGGIRFTEVGPGASDKVSAHPHFHCLLLVRPSMYAGKNYLSEKQWADEWQNALQGHYTPTVHSRRLKGKGGELRNEIISCTRYSMKPRGASSDRYWFHAAAYEMRGLRFVEPLGTVRALLSELHNRTGSALGEREDIKRNNEPLIRTWDRVSGRYQSDCATGSKAVTAHSNRDSGKETTDSGTES